MFTIQLLRARRNNGLTQLGLVVLLTVLLLFCMPLFASLAPRTVWAQAGNEVSTEEGHAIKPCSSCHSDESEAWESSAHGMKGTGSAGATCTDCHGDYVRGHPTVGLIPLVVDSSNCRTCHTETFHQWEQSRHATEGVQCISCHSVHDQELRLIDEKLCSSCHLESLNDPLHLAHWENGATCTSCHLTDQSAIEMSDHGIASIGFPVNDTGSLKNVASSNPVLSIAMAPTHDFVSVSASRCLDCHREDVDASGRITLNGTPTQVDSQAPELASRLKSAEKNNAFLTMLSAVNLGFGVGIGGIIGMVFVLVVATMSQRGKKP